MRGTFYSESGKTTSSTSSFIDVLADDGFCSRDIPYLQRLGVNTIVILDTDPTLSHETCMTKLDSAGIYVLVQLTGRRKWGNFIYNGRSISPIFVWGVGDFVVESSAGEGGDWSGEGVYETEEV